MPSGLTTFDSRFRRVTLPVQIDTITMARRSAREDAAHLLEMGFSWKSVHSEPNLRFVLHKTIPDDADLRQQWNTLLTTLDRPQVFYTYEWSLAVQRAYKATLKPLLFLAYDSQDCLCGIAALALGAGKDGKDEASFLCATTGDYCDFLCSPAHKPAFVAGVLAELKKQGVRNVTLTNMPEDSGTWAAIQQTSQENSFHAFARTAYLCAQVSLDKLERRPGGNGLVLPRKKMVRRFLNAMGRKTPVRLEHAKSWDEIQPILPEFIQAHVARFLVTGRVSNLVQRERRVFLEELAQLLAESGWITITRLTAGDKSFAWNYGFQFQDTWFWYQPTFDSDIEKYSPGFCLLSRIVEEAADNAGFKSVDLGLGAEDYKDRFCNQFRRTLYVTLRASSTRHAREIVRYRSAAAVAAWPVAEKSLRGAMTRATTVKHRLGRLSFRDACLYTVKRAESAIASRDEVFFYELTNPNPKLLESSQIFLKQIDLNTLADAAIQNPSDPQTLAYLLRCADRLGTSKQSVGYAIANSSGELLHFTWAQPFENFRWSELNSTLPSPAPGSVVLFDSWTPISQRGKGYYAPTLALVVSRIREEGKRSWGFSAATNTSSVRGLEKAGFQRAFTVYRYRMLWWQRIVRNAPAPTA